MALVFITGASAGLGRAVAELFLNRGDTVVGLSRSSSIEHANYRFHKLDLANPSEVNNFSFEGDADEVILINNAGILGETRHVGRYADHQLAEVMQVNVVALGDLMNKFIETYKDKKGVVMNISSGAGSFPIDGWGAYCASKAAVEMLSQVAAKECEQDGIPFRIVAVSPGIIDTGMQEQIRSADQKDFTDLQRFLDYKKEGELASPREAASKILLIFEKLPDLEGVSLSVRDF